MPPGLRIAILVHDNGKADSVAFIESTNLLMMYPAILQGSSRRVYDCHHDCTCSHNTHSSKKLSGIFSKASWNHSDLLAASLHVRNYQSLWNTAKVSSHFKNPYLPPGLEEVRNCQNGFTMVYIYIYICMYVCICMCISYIHNCIIYI